MSVRLYESRPVARIFHGRDGGGGGGCIPQ